MDKKKETLCSHVIEVKDISALPEDNLLEIIDDENLTTSSSDNHSANDNKNSR